jgi:hypothetical protein
MTYGREQRGTVVVVSGAAGGIGFGGLLTILFIGLRLGHVIDWPWWWVLAPVWITGTAVLTLIVACAVMFIGAGYVDARERERQVRARRNAPAAGEHGPAHRWGRR